MAIQFPVWSGGCLRIGHLDGKNRIYDSDGELILKESERLLGRYVKVELDIKKGWRMWMVESVFTREAGAVTCYITDRRIVCIRRPDVHKAGAYLMTPYGAAEGIADMYKARKILEAGGFEFCEFMPDEIRFYKKYPAVMSLRMMDGGKKYSADFTIKGKALSPHFRPALMSWVESKGISPA